MTRRKIMCNKEEKGQEGGPWTIRKINDKKEDKRARGQRKGK